LSVAPRLALQEMPALPHALRGDPGVNIAPGMRNAGLG
jgi:hypothetical protein